MFGLESDVLTIHRSSRSPTLSIAERIQFAIQSHARYSAAVMPHALKVSVYFMVWFVAVSLIAFRWFSEFNLPTGDWARAFGWRLR